MNIYLLKINTIAIKYKNIIEYSGYKLLNEINNCAAIRIQIDCNSLIDHITYNINITDNPISDHTIID